MVALELSEERSLVDRARSAPAAEREAAQRALYEALREPVLALCRNLTRHPQDAEDALQDVFLLVFRALPSFRGEARLSTWVLRIAIRAALSRRARSARHAGEPVDEALPDPSRGPEERADASLRARRVRRAFATLSAEHQAVLALFAIRGLSHKQIAEVLGLKEGTVWSRLSLARRKLAQAAGLDDASPP